MPHPQTQPQPRAARRHHTARIKNRIRRDFRWLARFLQGGWQNCRDGDISPDWAYNKQAGTVQTLHIAIDLYDTRHRLRCGEDNPLPTEFNWAVTAAPVDEYGQPLDPAHQWRVDQPRR